VVLRCCGEYVMNTGVQKRISEMIRIKQKMIEDGLGKVFVDKIITAAKWNDTIYNLLLIWDSGETEKKYFIIKDLKSYLNDVGISFESDV
jgi:hypothetical protein